MSLPVGLLVLRVARDGRSHPESLGSRTIPVDTRFSIKGFSRLHFVVVLSKILMTISQDHSLFTILKTGGGSGWLLCQ